MIYLRTKCGDHLVDVLLQLVVLYIDKNNIINTNYHAEMRNCV